MSSPRAASPDPVNHQGFANNRISGGNQVNGGENQFNIGDKKYEWHAHIHYHGSSPVNEASPSTSTPSSRGAEELPSSSQRSHPRKVAQAHHARTPADEKIESDLSSAITGFMARGRSILRPDGANAEQRPPLDPKSQTEPNSSVTTPTLQRNQSAPGASKESKPKSGLWGLKF